jgi:hypothetical protein
VLFVWAGSDHNCSDNDHERLNGVGMDSELSDTLEAIANLLYLIGKSPDNPAAVSIYVDLAEDRMRVIAARYRPHSSAERVLATCPASLPIMSLKSHNPSSDGMSQYVLAGSLFIVLKDQSSGSLRFVLIARAASLQIEQLHQCSKSRCLAASLSFEALVLSWAAYLVVSPTGSVAISDCCSCAQCRRAPS